jgi:hypothetical protein
MSSPPLLAAVGWPLIGGIIGAIVTWFGLVSGVWSFLVGLAVAGFVVAAPALSRRQARRRWLGYPYSRALVVSQVASGGGFGQSWLTGSPRIASLSINANTCSIAWFGTVA